eukprot:TRINITY_DN41529_c0_g1_i1.p1 TRINITY_DN41529_c0_g1~~TRINITY_DN41529_c0_g1_i1.p1  ORF type:complete len:306 (-),score=74.65 TRINITY_DN41529_c0_g1_i1:199-1116(-)
MSVLDVPMNELLAGDRMEALILMGFAAGATFLILHRLLARFALNADGRLAAVTRELQRKSFHILGGCIICSVYLWGVKWGVLSPAYHSGSLPGTQAADVPPGSAPLDAGLCFLAACFVSWSIEAARLLLPAVQKWYLGSFQGLIRDKELRRAAGIAYFLPGSLAAMLAAPPNVAILAILFLSLGDAAASLGTAAGRLPVGSSSRKVEGSVACFLVCTSLGVAAGLPVLVALLTSIIVTVGELLAEVIGLDDNFILPLLGVLGIRVGFCAQIWRLLAAMGATFAMGVLLGVLVGSATPKAEELKSS